MASFLAHHKQQYPRPIGEDDWRTLRATRYAAELVGSALYLRRVAQFRRAGVSHIPRQAKDDAAWQVSAKTRIADTTLFGPVVTPTPRRGHAESPEQVGEELMKKNAGLFVVPEAHAAEVEYLVSAELIGL